MKSRVLPRDWPLYIGHFSEVDNQPNYLMCYVPGSGARVVDQLDEQQVRIKYFSLFLNPEIFFYQEFKMSQGLKTGFKDILDPSLAQL